MSTYFQEVERCFAPRTNKRARLRRKNKENVSSKSFFTTTVAAAVLPRCHVTTGASRKNACLFFTGVSAQCSRFNRAYQLVLCLCLTTARLVILNVAASVAGFSRERGSSKIKRVGSIRRKKVVAARTEPETAEEVPERRVSPDDASSRAAIVTRQESEPTAGEGIAVGPNGSDAAESEQSAERHQNEPEMVTGRTADVSRPPLDGSAESGVTSQEELERAGQDAPPAGDGGDVRGRVCCQSKQLMSFASSDFEITWISGRFCNSST